MEVWNISGWGLILMTLKKDIFHLLWKFAKILRSAIRTSPFLGTLGGKVEWQIQVERKMNARPYFYYLRISWRAVSSHSKWGRSAPKRPKSDWMKKPVSALGKQVGKTMGPWGNKRPRVTEKFAKFFPMNVQVKLFKGDLLSNSSNF